MLNMGTAVGPMVDGMAALIDARFAFAASALLFGVLGATMSRSTIGSSETANRRAVLVNLRAAATNRNLWRLIVVSLPWFFLFPQVYVAFPLHAERLAGPYAASAVYVVNGVIGLAFMLAAKRWLARINPAISTMYAYLAAAVAFASVAACNDLAWFLPFIAGYTIIETVMLPALETMTGSLAVDGNQATSVTDRRNDAGDDRRNGASWKWCQTRIRTASRMRFFTGFCNGVFAAFRHRFGLAEALALDDDAIGTMA
nr:MFS transporter [Paraburkholderia sp. BL6665CI2N2]